MLRTFPPRPDIILKTCLQRGGIFQEHSSGGGNYFQTFSPEGGITLRTFSPRGGDYFKNIRNISFTGEIILRTCPPRREVF